MPDSVGREERADATAIVARLRDAQSDLEDAQATVDDVGRDRLVDLRDAVDQAVRLFDRYEDDATGTGDFQAYLSFQEDVVAFVEDLPEDLPKREVFENWLDDFKKRTIRTSDFERARGELDECHDLVERLDDLETARDDHRQAVASVKDELAATEDRIAHLERVRELGSADLDAPVEDLRDPIEAYNDTIAGAFSDLLRESSAREVFAMLDRAERFPLVDAPSPPDDLRAYVEAHDVGDEPVSRLLELAGYSHSKLDHFVDDPGRFKRVVGGNRTYLDSLSADSLKVEWPPAEAPVLRRRVDELVSLVAAFTPEDAVVRLREVQQVTREARFDDLRDAAIARDELDDADRERIRNGEVASELEALREQRDELETALDEYA